MSATDKNPSARCSSRSEREIIIPDPELITCQIAVDSAQLLVELPFDSARMFIRSRLVSSELQRQMEPEMRLSQYMIRSFHDRTVMLRSCLEFRSADSWKQFD